MNIYLVGRRCEKHERERWGNLCRVAIENENGELLMGISGHGCNVERDNCVVHHSEFYPDAVLDLIVNARHLKRKLDSALYGPDPECEVHHHLMADGNCTCNKPRG